MFERIKRNMKEALDFELLFCYNKNKSGRRKDYGRNLERYSRL